MSSLATNVKTKTHIRTRRGGGGGVRVREIIQLIQETNGYSYIVDAKNKDRKTATKLRH